MIRTALPVLSLLFLFIAPVSYAGGDMHIQCDDLKATYVVRNPSPSGMGGEERYHILFEAKEESMTRLVDAMHENFTNKVVFDVYVNGKIAEHYYRYPDWDFFPPLIYSPFFLRIDAGASREKAVALARNYCPATLPEGEVPHITYSEQMTMQNNWVREDRKRSDAARLRAAQPSQ